MTHRLGIIGGGNMGSAIVKGAVAAGVLDPDKIIIMDIDPRKLDTLAELGCVVTDDPTRAANAEQLMLAVKPQFFPDVAKRINPLAESKVVISIMAGLSSANIRKALGENARIVRVMPNTPCQVGEGMTAIALGEGAAQGDDELSCELFEALGPTVKVREDQMYAVTATSGSGPAYVFLLAEAMQAAAEKLGIEPDKAALLVSQTILGAGKLLSESNESPEALRKAVTSPKGTTEAALKVMFERDLPGIIEAALTAARDRGVEIDQG